MDFSALHPFLTKLAREDTRKKLAIVSLLMVLIALLCKVLAPNNWEAEIVFIYGAIAVGATASIWIPWRCGGLSEAGFSWSSTTKVPAILLTDIRRVERTGDGAYEVHAHGRLFRYQPQVDPQPLLSAQIMERFVKPIQVPYSDFTIRDFFTPTFVAVPSSIIMFNDSPVEATLLTIRAIILALSYCIFAAPSIKYESDRLTQFTGLFRKRVYLYSEIEEITFSTYYQHGLWIHAKVNGEPVRIDYQNYGTAIKNLLSQQFPPERIVHRELNREDPVPI
jgi:hypothetical protein